MATCALPAPRPRARARPIPAALWSVGCVCDAEPADRDHGPILVEVRRGAEGGEPLAHFEPLSKVHVDSVVGIVGSVRVLATCCAGWQPHPPGGVSACALHPVLAHPEEHEVLQRAIAHTIGAPRNQHAMLGPRAK